MIEFVAETETPGISPICGYKTSDGVFFQDKEQATKHQALIEAQKKARKNQIQIILSLVNEKRGWRSNYKETHVEEFLKRSVHSWDYTRGDEDLRRAMSTWSQLTSLKPLYEKYKDLI